MHDNVTTECQVTWNRLWTLVTHGSRIFKNEGNQLLSRAISRGSKLTSTSFQASYLAIGSLYGAHRRIARVRLSATI